MRTVSPVNFSRKGAVTRGVLSDIVVVFVGSGGGGGGGDERGKTYAVKRVGRDGHVRVL